MTWVASAVAVGGAALQYSGSRKAAKEQGNAARGANALSERSLSQIRRDQAPWQQSGVNALNQLNSFSGLAQTQLDDRQVGTGVFDAGMVANFIKQGYSVDDILKMGTFAPKGKGQWSTLQGAGLSAEDISRLQTGTFSPTQPAAGGSGGEAGTGTAGTPDYSAFYNTPDYKFALDQGTKAVERSAAARGGLNSGNTLVELNRYGQGLATQNFNNYTNRLMAMAGMGQTATNALSGYENSAGRDMADTTMAAGSARASGVAGQTNALADMVGGLGDAASAWWSTRKGRIGTPHYVKGNDGMVQTYGN